MDKRRLTKTVSRIQQQLFVTTAMSGFLVVFFVSLYFHGSNFNRILINVIAAFLVFGVLGYLFSRMYVAIVERPLIDSYREEERQRITELSNQSGRRYSMTVNVADLTPGMKVIDEVYNKEQALLVRAGAILNQRMINTLRENNITSVNVEGQKQLESGF